MCVCMNVVYGERLLMCVDLVLHSTFRPCVYACVDSWMYRVCMPMGCDTVCMFGSS